MSRLQVAYQQLMTRRRRPHRLYCSCSCSCCAVVVARTSSRCRRSRHRLRGLPVIGHLHLVGALPHVSLRDLSAKHGSSDGLLFLRLGSVPTLVLSSPVAAEAIMRTHDQVFASRPSSTISNDLLYGSSDIVFCPYGEHWRQIKKLVTTHLFTVKKDMFGAGAETSALVLELAMADLMRNPQKMSKLQEEIRKHTPEGQKMVEEEDLPSMSNLRAVVKETLRLHPPGPLLVPRLSMADCVVHGCHVPSGTRIIVNAWAIGRDPESWEKPEEFMPERFMDGGSAAGVDFKGNHFQFLPFGSGRRICPGLNFGTATVEIMLANLIYSFDWKLPTGMEEKDVDMTEEFGVTVHLKHNRPHPCSQASWCCRTCNCSSYTSYSGCSRSCLCM